MHRIPSRIGNVEIRGALARGGMGVVYVGTQPMLERAVVVKGLRGDATGDPARVQRFRREAQAAATVEHANVVAVHDAFEWRGQPWIVQEYVDGLDLAGVLREHGRFPWRVAALVGLSIVRGLEEVHDRGIVHRDLKPSNVLLGRAGDVKICDFGIALDHHGPGLTRTGFALGTVPYMAPEQMLGDPVDFRGDLFALGILLYEMLCGQVPFSAHDPEGDLSLVRRIQAQRYLRVRKRRRDVPRWLARTVETCLRAKARRRGGSTTELRRDLERRLGHPSPADARAEIAGFLAPTFERLIASEDDVRTDGRQRPDRAPADQHTTPGPTRILDSGPDAPRWRWTWTLAGATALAAAVVLGWWIAEGGLARLAQLSAPLRMAVGS